MVLEEKCFFVRDAFKLVATVVLLACSLEAGAVGLTDKVFESGDGEAMLLTVGVEKINVEVDGKLGVGLKERQFGIEGGAKVFSGGSEASNGVAAFREPVGEGRGVNDSGYANSGSGDWEIWLECLYWILYPTVALWLAGGLDGGGRGHDD